MRDDKNHALTSLQIVYLEAFIQLWVLEHHTPARATPLFPGPLENIIEDAPRASKKTKVLPSKGCISKTWLRDSACDLTFPEDDESVTVLKQCIPRSYFDTPEKSRWLFQFENGDEEVEGGEENAQD
jgi:hypothetical protein